MSSVSGASGQASLQAAKQAGDAAFFASLVQNAQKREAASAQAMKAEQAPVTLTLGGNAITLESGAASELAMLLTPNSDLYNANPGQLFDLPGGGQATGLELSTALATLILEGKA